MASTPKLSQTTAIAKATTTANQLDALLPNVASEYSPVRVYMPSGTSEVLQHGAGTAKETHVWVAPDVNGDGSDYLAQVECIGAGGGGGGGSSRLAAPPVYINGRGITTAATSFKLASGTAAYQGGTIVVVVYAHNNTAQTVTVTDASGNKYTQIGSSTASASGSMYILASVGVAAIPASAANFFTITSTNSQVMTAGVLYLPDVNGVSSAAAASASAASVAASANYPTLTYSYNANDLVLAFTAATAASTIPTLPVWSSANQDWIDVTNDFSNLTNDDVRCSWTQRGYAPGSSAGGSSLAPTTGSPGHNGSTAVTGVNIMQVSFTTSHAYGTDTPGSGGGGGEYACEPSYPIAPGTAYTYSLPNSSPGGYGPQDGSDGGDTVFDPSGKGMQGGIVAHGGKGGKYGGSAGTGGTGSVNNIHFDGGKGGFASAGVGTDYAPAYTTNSDGLNYLAFNTVLDENTGITPQNASYFGGTPADSHVALGAALVPVSGAPVQVAPSGNPNTTPGNALYFNKGTSTGVVGGIKDSNAGTAITDGSLQGVTLSVWVKGDPNATGPADWNTGTPSSDPHAYLMGDAGLCLPGGGNYPRGFVLFIQNNLTASGGVVRFTTNNASGGASSYNLTPQTTAATISATDGKWHHIMVIADFVSQACLYVDGVLAAQGSGSISSGGLAAGNGDFVVGYNYLKNYNGFKGVMSNPWAAAVDVSSLTTPAGSPATTTVPSLIYGSLMTTGGAGGGASGGSAGTGNPGTNPAGTTGSAGGAGTAASSSITLASAAGGAGGNAGSNGTAGTIGGAGGGGAGSSFGVPIPTNFLNVPIQQSATYNGIDGTSAGSVYSVSDSEWDSSGSNAPGSVLTGTSLCITGGKSENPSAGTMNSILRFQTPGNQLTVDGTPLGTASGTGFKWTVVGTYLNLTINSTDGAMISVSCVYDNGDIPDELTDTELAAWASATAPAQYDYPFYIPAGVQGRMVQIPLPLNNRTYPATVIIGTFSGSASYAYGEGAYSADEAVDWYCEFFGAGTGTDQDAYLTFEYALYSNGTAPGVINGGSGGAGAISITVADPEGTPVTTILPAAQYDHNGDTVNGNQLAAGITTANITCWVPNSSPRKLEYWHQVGAAGEVAFASPFANNTSVAPLEYRIFPDGTVRITGQVKVTATISGTNTIFTLPSGYYSTTKNEYMSTIGINPANANTMLPVLLVVTTSGAVEVYNLAGGNAFPTNSFFNIGVSYPVNN